MIRFICILVSLVVWFSDGNRVNIRVCFRVVMFMVVSSRFWVKVEDLVIGDNDKEDFLLVF